MNEELVSNLIKDFPIIFSKLEYIEADDGWEPLIRNLCSTIESYIHSNQELLSKKEEIYATQIKSKFGGLRFDLSEMDDYIAGAISLAENFSGKICEVCGNLGKKKNIKGWISTFCPAHENIGV